MGLDGIRFYSTSPREIPAIGVLIKLARAGAARKKNSERRSAVDGCQPQGEKFADANDDGDDDDRSRERAEIAGHEGEGAKKTKTRFVLRCEG